jgi:hypothetical protein
VDDYSISDWDSASAENWGVMEYAVITTISSRRLCPPSHPIFTTSDSQTVTLLLQTLDIRTHLAWPTWTLVKEMVIMDYVMDTKTETDNLA